MVSLSDLYKAYLQRTGHGLVQDKDCSGIVGGEVAKRALTRERNPSGNKSPPT